MRKAKQTSAEPSRKICPALSPEAREKQMVSLAIDLAEKQLLEGTASSQVITHFLKIGSIREQRELEKLKQETEQLRAKTEALQSAKNIEELYAKAIKSMRIYSGQSEDEDYEDEQNY